MKTFQCYRFLKRNFSLIKYTFCRFLQYIKINFIKYLQNIDEMFETIYIIYTITKYLKK